jgi:hypothetical protein
MKAIKAVATLRLASREIAHEDSHAGRHQMKLALGTALAGGAFLLMASEPNVSNVFRRSSAETRATSAAVIPAQSDSQSLRNLQNKIDRLERGCQFLERIDGYTACLAKQEVVDGQLLDEQSMQMKLRHEPFSVYLLWQAGDIGREVIYVEDQNRGRMIAHDGGWKARIPAISLSPDSRLAMRDARYPVTNAGMLGLARTMLDIHRSDLQSRSIASCEMDENTSFDGRKAVKFTTMYASRDISPVYRKSITYLDSEWNVPVSSSHFEWPAIGDASAGDLDQQTLIESYSFTSVQLPAPLTDLDFDRKNPEYKFR